MSSALVDELARLSPGQVPEFVASLGETERLGFITLLYDWETAWARDSQKEPPGDWRIWMVKAGRGYGKTRIGSEWVRKHAQSGQYGRMALVARTSADVRDVVIEGESGILAVSPDWFRPHYEPSKRRLTWPNGAMATTYSAEEPDVLRGPQHDAFWADEIATWKYPETWDNLMFGLRLGSDPRGVVTTTPQPVRLIRELMADQNVIVTGGSTYENAANLAPAFLEKIIAKYEGTNRGRQEIHAEVLDEAEGALWTREMIEQHRELVADWSLPESAHLTFDRIVVAIDPAVTSTEQSDETGIVIAGSALRSNGRRQVQHFWVMRDISGRYSPSAWAQRAIDAHHLVSGDRIVGEVNNGGEMIEQTLRTIDPDVPYKAVTASRGKAARAEPIAALYEQGRVHHVDHFTDLEDQLCNWVPNSGQRSPDRLDALVWAITELMAEVSISIDVDDAGGLGKTSYWRL